MCIHTTTPLLAAPVDAVDFFIPQSTRHEATTTPVRHKQTWSTWRGLSSAHAEELAICELAFRQAIQEKITAYVDGFIGSPAIYDTIFTIKVNLVELAVEIMEVYFEANISPSPLLSLKNVVHFVGLHDCLVRTTSASCLDKEKSPIKGGRPARIQVRMSQGSSVPVITTNPPRLIFDDLVLQVEQGQNYYLKPRYTHTGNVSQQSACNTKVTYSTTCEWLKYNGEKNHFAGTVPQSNEGAQHIEVKATAIHNFPGTHVSHEESITASVTILPVVVGLEVEHTTDRPFVKQVRFASNAHVWKAPKCPLLRSRNSCSMLQSCSNLSHDRRLAVSSSSCKDATRVYLSPPTSESGDSDPEVKGTRADTTTLDSESESSGSEHRSSQDKFASSLSVEANDALDHDSGLDSLTAEGAQLSGIMSSQSCLERVDPLDARNVPSNSVTSSQLHPEIDDDGISEQLFENVRKLEGMKFPPDEDPRDVREMKKELLQMRLQELSTNMLGFKVDRWSTDEVSEQSDVLESGDDSALESSLRESIGY